MKDLRTLATRKWKWMSIKYQGKSKPMFYPNFFPTAVTYN